jgi:ubiquitin-like protein ATG12
VRIHLVPVGSAPLLKKSKFQLGCSSPFSTVSAFLRRQLSLPPATALFLYLNAAFCPSPDQVCGELSECFAVRGDLVVHYALQEAFG